MDRYDVGLILVALAALPLVYLNYWFALASAGPAYILLAKVAARSLDRRSAKARQRHMTVKK